MHFSASPKKWGLTAGILIWDTLGRPNSRVAAQAVPIRPVPIRPSFIIVQAKR